MNNLLKFHIVLKHFPGKFEATFGQNVGHINYFILKIRNLAIGEHSSIYLFVTNDFRKVFLLMVLECLKIISRISSPDALTLWFPLTLIFEKFSETLLNVTVETHKSLQKNVTI